MRRVVLALIFVFVAHSTAFATWSVIALDPRTGEVVIASATCVPQGRLEAFPARDLMDVQAIVVPGKGVAAAQAGVDRSRANQMLIFNEINNGTDPARIVEMLSEDPAFGRRQFGIIDMQGRGAGHSGDGNSPASLHAIGGVDGTPIMFGIQGNILASDAVVNDAVVAFRNTDGALTDRVMAAMEAADALGGDVRCTCETPPLPDAPCEGKTAHVAYILRADADDPSGSSHNDGTYAMYISVTDADITPDENANPVKTLRMRYDAEMRR